MATTARNNQYIGTRFDAAYNIVNAQQIPCCEHGASLITMFVTERPFRHQKIVNWTSNYMHVICK